MLAAGMLTYFTTGQTDNNAIFLGVCIKVGIVLITISLAWPAMETWVDRSPGTGYAVLLGVVIAFALGRRILPIIIAFIVIGLVVHFGMRFVSQKFQR